MRRSTIITDTNEDVAIGWAAFSAVAVAAVVLGTLFGGAHIGALLLLGVAFVWSAHHFVLHPRS